MFSNLIREKRYYFHIKEEENIKVERATFLSITGPQNNKFIGITEVESESCKNIVLYIPVDNIIKIENYEDVFNSTKLPVDTMRIIDSYY
jgi:hypothetical protein